MQLANSVIVIWDWLCQQVWVLGTYRPSSCFSGRAKAGATRTVGSSDRMNRRGGSFERGRPGMATEEEVKVWV